MTFMNLSRNFDITATIEALCQSKDSQLLADPSVTVVDREPATIQVVTEIPYQQLTQTQQGGNIGTTAFREAGVTLRVVPHIANDGTVQMEVTPTFSRLTGFTNGQNPQPIIDKREAQTTVRVGERNWLVIGGLRQRTAVKDDRAIPGLTNIKYLGKLFRAHDYSFRESELIVFLMPEMITPVYAGREREQVVQGASQAWLDETPVAPQILGQGEVGCSLCGQKYCHGCQNLNWWKGRPDTSEFGATNGAGDTAGSIRRLPRVETEATRLPAVDPQPAARPQPAKKWPGMPLVKTQSSKTAEATPELPAKPTIKPATKSKADSSATAKPTTKPKTESNPKATAEPVGTSRALAEAKKQPSPDKSISKVAAKPAEKNTRSWMGSWLKPAW
jgi:hypothetical protein